MSALGDLAAGTGSVVAGQLWKVATLVLGAVLLAGGGAGGALWWSAAAARDQALADLHAKQGINAQLRAGVDAQNTEILTQATLAREAEARGQAVMQPPRRTADATIRRCSRSSVHARPTARRRCPT